MNPGRYDVSGLIEAQYEPGSRGRVLRLLALLMGLQAGLPPLDFSPLAGRGLKRYVAGIHAATGRDYGMLIGVFRKVIDRTWRNASSSGR